MESRNNILKKVTKHVGFIFFVTRDRDRWLIGKRMKGSSPLALVLNVVVCTFWFERERDQLRLGVESNLWVSFQDSSYIVRHESVKGRTSLLEGFFVWIWKIVRSVCVCVYFVCMRRLTRLGAWFGCVCMNFVCVCTFYVWGGWLGSELGLVVRVWIEIQMQTLTLCWVKEINSRRALLTGVLYYLLRLNFIMYSISFFFVIHL